MKTEPDYRQMAREIQKEELRTLSLRRLRLNLRDHGVSQQVIQASIEAAS